MAPKSPKSGQKKPTPGKKKQKPVLPATEEEEPVNMESMGHPEIYPLVLTTKTQEIFNCRVDQDVTDKVPYKLIKKEDIFADLRNRAAVSDFHPIKKIVQEYPGNEILLVYDKDFKYGLNFYVIGTEEGKENYFKAPELPEEQEEFKELITEETFTYVPPVSKPWVSLGSEKEIEEESVKKSTKQTRYSRRDAFPLLTTKCVFWKGVLDEPLWFIKVSTNVKELSSKGVKIWDASGSWGFLDSLGCSSSQEGHLGPVYGFPWRHFGADYKDMDSDCPGQGVGQLQNMINAVKTNPDDRRIIMYSWNPKDLPLVALPPCHTQLCSVEIALQQNEIMNLFIDDWKSLAEEEGTFGDKTNTHLKEYQSFTDLHSQTEKMITCVSWHPTIYGERDTTWFPFAADSEILMLESPDDIFCFKFCPSDPNIIAGGCINGQVVLWDITAHADRLESTKAGGGGSKKAVLKPMFLLEPDSNKEAMYIRHCAVSSIESGHKSVITDIHWLANTFEKKDLCKLPFSTICFWDIRPQKTLTPAPTEKKKEESIEIPFDIPSTFLHLDLSWKPLTRIKLSKGETTLDHCPTKISLSEDQLLSKTSAKKPMSLFSIHDGAVHTIQRSPFYNDIILTVGGWNVAIWKEGVMSGPLLQTCCAAKRYTAGHWSLTRPGVFYIGREDGYVDIWDLLEKTHEPAQSQNICITMITYIKPWTFSAKQQFIAIADYYGTLHILEIPWTLSHPSTNEVSSVNYYFEREVKHLEYVEQRKSIREQEKKKIELETEKKKHKTYQKSKEQIEAELKLDYESYLELEKNILINLGLMKAPEITSHMEMM
ncbi:WD repeat-containing protein 63 [Octodon degus]|uniref:Thymidylate synthase n=1 Tax=Octodon degus TaxID=10160 RepID=A0A6P6D3Z3_OCTDE|nr:WD repeat-containing protein 63 [Octodon degus]